MEEIKFCRVCGDAMRSKTSHPNIAPMFNAFGPRNKEGEINSYYYCSKECARAGFIVHTGWPV